MKRSLVAVVGLCLSLTLCEAKTQKPLFVSPDLNPAQIDRIDVFVVDLNNDSANDRECIGGVEVGTFNGGGGVDQTLPRRGYNKSKKLRTRFYVAPITLSETMLSNPTKEWLQDLANRKYSEKSKDIPPPGRWIMIVTIDELGSRENAIKGLGRGSLSMYLYDRDQGTLLWRDHAVSEHMWGGLLGNVMDKGATKQMYCSTLVGEMVMKLPKRKK